jgi:hypothetical protein
MQFRKANIKFIDIPKLFIKKYIIKIQQANCFIYLSIEFVTEE